MAGEIPHNGILTHLPHDKKAAIFADNIFKHIFMN